MTNKYGAFICWSAFNISVHFILLFVSQVSVLWMWTRVCGVYPHSDTRTHTDTHIPQHMRTTQWHNAGVSDLVTKSLIEQCGLLGKTPPEIRTCLDFVFPCYCISVFFFLSAFFHMLAFSHGCWDLWPKKKRKGIKRRVWFFRRERFSVYACTCFSVPIASKWRPF